MQPALLHAPLGTPGDLDHARVLALLATRERRADPRLVAVVVGGIALAAGQEELRQPVAGAHQVTADVLDTAHEVAEALVGYGRHERDDSSPAGGPSAPHRGGLS